LHPFWCCGSLYHYTNSRALLDGAGGPTMPAKIILMSGLLALWLLRGSIWGDGAAPPAEQPNKVGGDDFELSIGRHRDESSQATWSFRLAAGGFLLNAIWNR